MSTESSNGSESRFEEANVINCAQCGKAYCRRRDGGGYKYCSKECAAVEKIAYAEALRIARRRSREERKAALEAAREWKCRDCGRNFRGRKSLRCEDCRTAHKVKLALARDGRRGVAKRCDDCGADFVTSSNLARCRPCRDRLDRERRRSVQTENRRKRIANGEAAPLADGHATGAIAELLFDVFCLSQRWLVARPVIDCNPGWDRIIIRPGRAAERVQIKGVRIPPRRNTFSVPKKQYISPADCDIVAVIDAGMGEGWMLDASDPRIKTSVDRRECEDCRISLW